jgi:hypothetical protein
MFLLGFLTQVKGKPVSVLVVVILLCVEMQMIMLGKLHGSASPDS